MPKAKFKRKGAPPELLAAMAAASASTPAHLASQETSAENTLRDSCVVITDQSSTSPSTCSILHLPEEVICLIVALLKEDTATLAALEATCRRLRQVIVDARLWRRLLASKLEQEPGLRGFLTPSWLLASSQEHQQDTTSEQDHLRHKKEMQHLSLLLHHVWYTSSLAPSLTRTNKVFNQEPEPPATILYHIVTSGKYFAAFYGPSKVAAEAAAAALRLARGGGGGAAAEAAPLHAATGASHVIDIFDRGSRQSVRRLDNLLTKPDLFRIVEELDIFLITYPGFLMVEVIKLGREEPDYIDLGKPGDTDTAAGSICDIVVRDNISIRGTIHRRVVMVALNTEPADSSHFHIGELQMFSLSAEPVHNIPLWSFIFLPVPLAEGRFFNQCIQKKGLSDFSTDHVVVVVGGCEGSAVLGVVEVAASAGGRVAHKLRLRGGISGGSVSGAPPSPPLEGGCEGGACHYSVISLMIDRRQPDLCAVLLSTGQLNVIHLVTGDTLFHRHLQFEGQLKVALHQPDLLGTQRIAIKFRNFITFYDLVLSRRSSQIRLEHVRTLRITSIDGRETRLDDNPSQELRRQFGELQKRVRALNHYTSGIQKKLDKGLRPGTVTQGVLSMTKKVHMVTSKLDQAHGKAREIEAIVIASIAFDNRYCHALTLNRDLVIFDMLGALEFYESPHKRRRGRGKEAHTDRAASTSAASASRSRSTGDCSSSISRTGANKSVDPGASGQKSAKQDAGKNRTRTDDSRSSSADAAGTSSSDTSNRSRASKRRKEDLR